MGIVYYKALSHAHSAEKHGVVRGRGVAEEKQEIDLTPVHPPQRVHLRPQSRRGKIGAKYLKVCMCVLGILGENSSHRIALRAK
jgi:hypothetical protein